MDDAIVQANAPTMVAGHDWQTAAAAFLQGQDVSPVSEHEEDRASLAIEGHSDIFLGHENPEAQAEAQDEQDEKYVGVFRTYDLRRGINRQPLMEYYDLDTSGTYRGHQSPGSDDERREPRKRSATAKSSRRLRIYKEEASDIPDSPSSGQDTDSEFDLGAHVVVERRSALNHPMTFFVSPSTCHWCHDVAYGLLEPGPATSARYQMKDETSSLQWFPESGPLRRHREIASHICTGHAMPRLGMALCPCHHITLINAQTREHAKTPIEAADRLKKALQRLQQRCIRPTDQFCDICLNLATFHCDRYSMHATTTTSTRVTQQIPGCGLRLCDLCANLMKARSTTGCISGSDVQQHLTWLLSTKDNPFYPCGPRPDAELLMSDGLLVRNYKQLVKQTSMAK